MGKRVDGGVLSPKVVDAVSEAGELLIRAAAVLGKLKPQELEALCQATDGKLPDCLAWALEGAGNVSEQVRRSLNTHPPAGWKVSIAPAVNLSFKGSP